MKYFENNGWAKWLFYLYVSQGARRVQLEGEEGGTLLLNCCMISALVGHHNVILAFGGVLQTSMSEEGPTIRGLS